MALLHPCIKFEQVDKSGEIGLFHKVVPTFEKLFLFYVFCILKEREEKLDSVYSIF
jgi:hypothetical protein